MPSNPYIPFYVGDYKKSLLRSSTLASRGLWLELLCIMWEAPRRGYLMMPSGKEPSPEQLARLVGCSVKELQACMGELESVGVFVREEDTGLLFDPDLVQRASALTSNASRQANFRSRRGSTADCGEVTPERDSGSNASSNASSNGGVTQGVTPKVTAQSNSIQSNSIQEVHEEEGGPPAPSGGASPGGDSSSSHRQKKRIEPKHAAGPAIPPELDETQFLEAWGDYLAYRGQIRKPLKPASVQALLNRLGEFGAEWSERRIRDAIANGWQGLIFDRDDPARAHAPPRDTGARSVYRPTRPAFQKMQFEEE